METGNAQRGAEVFVQSCAHCHTIDKGGKHIFGPNLYSIFGQKSGQIPGSKSSQVYKDRGITWTPGTMYEYLEDTSKAKFPGSKKPYPGLKDGQDRWDVVAYMQTQADKAPFWKFW